MALKTKKPEIVDNAILMDLESLQYSLGCGRYTAKQIAEAAGAKITFGRRVLYNRKKIEKYLDTVEK